MKDKAAERAALVQRIEADIARGLSLRAACAEAGVHASWFLRWAQRFQVAGMDGLADLPRSGRPSSVALTPEDRKALRSAYLRSNLNAHAGSMTLAARYCAKTGQLTDAAAEAVLKPRASKHLLPAEIRRACRASAAEVARYRDHKAGLNDGLFVPGWLRMSADGARRLCPNQRWVGDDASVNVGVCVPWTRGGDPCSDRWGVRVSRFQLLALLDCATDMCVGYNYVMRTNDAYSAADVVSLFYRVGLLRGGMPAEMVCEGGSWQAERTRAFLAACGTQLVSAKGRPNQKLIEGWFSRLWSVMSLTLPPGGQVGRFRGEMSRENDLWMRCRRGSEDPRRHFPLITDFYRALDGAIDYCNAETCGPTKNYGTWIPAQAYTAREGLFPQQALRTLPAGIRRFALPVREERTLSRGGMAGVRAASPIGEKHDYAFAIRDGALFDGAPVTVSFDPSDIAAGAVVELRANWRDLRAGRVLDEAALCVSPAPLVVRTRNIWHVETLDPRRQAAELKRAGRALVGSLVAAFDGRGAVARHEETADPSGAVAAAFSLGTPAAAPVAAESGYDNDVDFAALEAAANIA